MKIKYYVVKKISQKEGKAPFAWLQLVADLGYGKQQVSMDRNVIAGLLGVGVGQLYDYCKEPDLPYFVGDFIVDMKAEVK